MIDRQTVERIMSTADIVEVVSEFVTLKKAGTNWKGLCPFHNEKTPSFMVSPSKGICKCFSCGKGGNVAHFLMEHEQMSYPEALRWLAKKYHIEIKEHELTAEDIQRNNLRESLLVITAWADEYFQNTLHNTQEGQSIGLSYFRNRGLRDDVIKTFRLGYCLQKGRELADTALKKGFNEDFLIRVGVCNKNEHGLYDKYRGRVIYPIQALDGKVIGFGARTLSQSKDVAKYMNSPESEIYDKSNGVLYGLYQAKKEIQNQDLCFLVEGYMDVISMHQSGIRNVVASSGTSLTYGQIRLIRRFTKNITVLYDGDSAGIKASLRGTDMLLEEGMNIRILLLPDGDDPDSFSRKHTSEDFAQYVNTHQVDFIRFKADILMKDIGDDPIKKSEVVRSVVESIAKIPDPLVRSTYVKLCSSVMDERESVLIYEINRVKRKNDEDKKKKELRESEAHDDNAAEDASDEGNAVEERVESTASTVRPVRQESPVHDVVYMKERELIKAIVKYGELPLYKRSEEEGGGSLRVAEYVHEELQRDGISFKTPQYQRIMDECLAHVDEEDFHSSSYFVGHPDADLSQMVSDMISDRYQISDRFAKEQNIGTELTNLNETIPILLIDLKLAIVTVSLKAILQDIQQNASKYSPEEMKEKMKVYSTYKLIQKQLTALGGDRTITV